MKNKLLVILDAGHGGIINGEYVTAGKRSPIWPDGRQLFEGVFNRFIVDGINKRLSALCIDSVVLVPEQQDTSLTERVKRANEIDGNYKGDTLLISIHCNAGGGTGYEVYTYFGQTQSDVFATHLADAFNRELPNVRLRADMSDGDTDKEANFYILRKTAMPAVLSECLFMDTLKDCEILMSADGRQSIIDFHVTAIIEYKDMLCRN